MALEKSNVKVISSKISPYVHRVKIALLEKGIPFESIEVLDFFDKPKVLLDANPIHRKVPVLIHNDRTVIESLVILQYLEDAWPELVPLLPEDAYEKARVRFWVEYFNSNFAFTGPMFTAVQAKKESPEYAAALEASLKFYKTLEEGMLSFSADGPFFTGEKFGYLDVVCASLSSFSLLFRTLGDVNIPGPEEMPRYYKWVKAVTAHPSVSAVLPAEEEVLDYLTKMMKKIMEAQQARQNVA